MSLRTVSVLAAAAGWIALVCSAAPAEAATAPVKITVLSPEISLVPNGSAEIAVLVENLVNAALTARITRTDDDALRISPEAVSQPLAANASTVVRFKVVRKAEGRGKSALVNFIASASAAVSTGRVVGASAAVLTVNTVDGPAVAEAKIESNVTAINENRPGTALLIVANPGMEPMSIQAVTAVAPASVSIELRCPDGQSVTVKPASTGSGCTFSVPAHDQKIVGMTMSTDEALAPGPRQVALKVSAKDNASEATVGIVATTAFQVEVYAESDILKFVGVPIFLLLPGVLVVVCAAYLLRRVSPWRHAFASGTSDSPMQTVATAAVIGLAASLVIAAAYPLLTKHLVPGEERNFLKAYGFVDFYLVIGYAFAIAVVVWLLALLAALGRPAYRWAMVPGPGESPEGLLRKVGLRGLIGGHTKFRRVGVNGKYGLDLGGRSADKQLVTPALKATVKKAVPSNDAAKTVTAIEDHAEKERAVRLWWYIRRGIRGGKLTLAYNTGATELAKPTIEDRNILTETKQTAPVVIAGIEEP